MLAINPMNLDRAEDAARRLRGEACANCVHFAAVGECWKDGTDLLTGAVALPPQTEDGNWCPRWSQDTVYDEQRGAQKRDLLRRIREGQR